MSLLSDAQLLRYRVPLVALACFQAFLGSGIFYGWASLYTLCLDAGVYRDRCEPGEQVCSAQKEQLTLIYTGQAVAASVNLCSQLPWGCILDFLGPRVCNLWSTALVITGFVLLSLSARGTTDSYMLAMCLIGGAGPGAQISLFHLSELFPLKQKSTVLSIVTGAFQLGFIVFLLFHQAYTHLHISLANLALLYCLPLAGLLLLGGVLWPDAPCIPPDDLDPMSFTSRRPSQGNLVEYTSKSGSLARPMKFSGPIETPSWIQQAPGIEEIKRAESAEPTPVDEEAESQPLFRNVNPEATSEKTEAEYGSFPPDDAISPSLHHVHRSLHALRVSQSNPNLKGAAASKGFLSQLIAPSYLLCLFWMSICLFWANFYIGTVVEQLWVKSGFQVDSTRHYTDIFTLCLPVGVLGIGVFGWLTSELGFSTSIASTSIFAAGYAASSLWLPLAWQPLTFVLYSLFRSFLFSVMFAYLANEFGYRHFGLLSGIMLAVGGALGFLQYSLVRRMVVQDHTSSSDGGGGGGHDSATVTSSFQRVNQLQFVTLLATFYFAIFVLYRQRARAGRVERLIQEHTVRISASPAH